MSGFTTAQYDALKAAYAQGVLRVNYGDREVIYRSRAEMKQILDEIAEELGTTVRTCRSTLTSFSKG